MVDVRPSTIIYATVGTAATALLAYGIYFDHKRRNDPDFRKKLKREARKQARTAREEEEAEGKEQRTRIRRMVDEALEEGFPSDPEEREQYFMQQLGEGEALGADPSTLHQAALGFYKAYKVYPSQKDLMQLYDKTVPKPVLDIIAEMVAYDRVMSDSNSAGSSVGGVE